MALARVLVVLSLVLLAAPAAQAQAPVLEDPAGARSLADLVAAQDVEGLRRHGESVVPHLIALYRRGDQAERANLAWLFYHLGYRSEALREVLWNDLDSRHPDLRIWAQYAVGRVSDREEVVDRLFEIMRRDGEKFLFRDKAACGLAYDQIHLSDRQRARLFLLLVGALADPDPTTRRLAIQVLQVHTGQTKGYDADAPLAERQRSMEVWARWLNELRANL